MPRYRSHRGLVGGLVILSIGVILLLDQEGIVSAGHVFAVFWPALFLFLGLEDMIAGSSPKKQVWGALLFIGGSLFLLHNLGYIHVRFALLGPIVLIALGIWMLVWANASPCWHNGPFGRRGPFGHHGPFGPHGPLGPNGPLGPHGPIGRIFGSREPNPQAPPAQNPGQTGAESTNPATPDAGTSQGPYSNVSGFAGGPEPQNWHEWHRQQKWERRQQRRAWKQQWTGQHWAGQQPNSSGGYDSNESQFSYSAVLSHVERNITAKNFKSGTVSAFFGGFDIDLSRADIEGDEAVILADAFFGGGEIRIP